MRILLVAVALAVGVGVQAQDQPDAKDKELAALKQQIAQMQQAKPQPTLKDIQESYAKTLKEVKERAEPGCKSAGGRLSVSETDGKLSITCAFR